MSYWNSYCPQPPLHTVPLCLLHNDKCRELNRKGNPRSGYAIHLVWLVFVLIGLYFTAPRHLLELHLRLLGRCLLIVLSSIKMFLGLQTVLRPKGFTCYWTSLPSPASSPFGDGLTFQREATHGGRRYVQSTRINIANSIKSMSMSADTESLFWSGL